MIADVRAAWRNARQYRGRRTSLSLLVVLGSIVGLTGVGIVAEAARTGSHQILDGIALRTIELSGGPASPGARPLTTSNLTIVRAVPHVRSIEPTLQASFGVKTDTIPGVIWYATVARPSTPPPVVRSVRAMVFPLRPGEVVLPDTTEGINLTQEIGRRLPISYTRQIAPQAGEPVASKLVVVAVYRHDYTADGPAAAYAYPGDVSTWAAARAGVGTGSDYLATVGYQQASVIVDQAQALPGVERELARKGFQAVSVQERLSQLPRQVTALRILSLTVVAMLIGYCVIAGSSLAHSFVRQRTREIGLLKALGYDHRRILRILGLELLIAGALPAIVGTGAGVVVSVALARMSPGQMVFGIPLDGGSGMPPLRWIATLLLAPTLAILLGGLAPAWRSARLQPDVALREWR